MDLLGTTMGFVTIPMALLTIGSVAGGIVLLATGHGMLVLWGLAALAVGIAIARPLERIVVTIDEAAVRSKMSRNASFAMPIAILSGALPMIVVLGWEVACFQVFRMKGGDAPEWARWLWSYGAATGPWTIFALRVSRFRRTLCSIRAYAGHLGYWLLSVLVLFGHLPVAAAAVAMALPAILPLIVGTLLAVADRDALSNVRV